MLDRKVDYSIMQSHSEILWQPTHARITASHYAEFVSNAGIAHDVNPENASQIFQKVHRWSIDEPGIFWRLVWKYAGLVGDLGPTDFVRNGPLWNRPFFPQGSLSFAENILQPQRLTDPDFAKSIAIVATDEAGAYREYSRQELANQVSRLANHFRESGVVAGDRIAAVLSNRIEAIVGLLAASCVGAIWTCCSPDFGDDAVVDRFAQIEPVLLLTESESCYAGKRFGIAARVRNLLPRLPSIRQWIVCGEEVGDSQIEVIRWETIEGEATCPLIFEYLPFNHPLYILYSSGTTGKPKCIVHSAGGSLLQHVKEHQLHLDVHHSDRMFYYTSTGWMMWNWLVSALRTASSIVLYDGSPVTPNLGVLWELADQTKVTHFGASARYYATLEKEAFCPRQRHDLKNVRCIMSTGSPLLAEQFRWLYQAVGEDIHLASISGGTDIVSCFVLGNPTLPVRAGEIQGPGLGMDVRVVDSEGTEVVEQPGELICANAFPSMPIGFWSDSDRTKFRQAYFERFPEAWWHGDWTKRTASGGFVIFGRSDATLNPGGVRIGTGEIYQQVEAFTQIAESLATVIKTEGDEKIVLFVKMRPGQLLTTALVEQLRHRLRQNCSPRHTPAYVVGVPDLPKTMSGKLSEIAVRNALLGAEIGNAAALANPECLTFFSEWARMIE
jgi:acetoacetyl-CoA synthetase